MATLLKPPRSGRLPRCHFPKQAPGMLSGLLRQGMSPVLRQKMLRKPPGQQEEQSTPHTVVWVYREADPE